MGEGVLVLLAAFAIARQTWLGRQLPHAPRVALRSVGLNAAGGVLNCIWAAVLIRVGPAWRPRR
jgi:hypothetical protein